MSMYYMGDVMKWVRCTLYIQFESISSSWTKYLSHDDDRTSTLFRFLNTTKQIFSSQHTHFYLKLPFRNQSVFLRFIVNCMHNEAENVLTNYNLTNLFRPRMNWNCSVTYFISQLQFTDHGNINILHTVQFLMY